MMTFSKALITFLGCSLLGFASASNILFFMPFGSASHGITMIPVMEGLANKGHNVTYLTLIAPKSQVKNVTVLVMTQLNDMIEAKRPNSFKQRRNFTNIKEFIKLVSDDACRGLMEEENFRNVIGSKVKYDVIVMDTLASDCGLSIVPLLSNPPLIYYCTTSVYTWIAYDFDLPTPLSFVPTQAIPLTDSMTFWQRLANFVFANLAVYVNHWYVISVAQSIISEYHENIPPLIEIRKNVSLVLTNSLPSLDFPRPTAPFLVEVGGTHLQKNPKRLPPELERFVNKSIDGFIYFSLGTNVRDRDMPGEVIQLFLKAFANIKYPVLWKYDSEMGTNLPDNVLIQKWVPQQDILSTSRCKLFVTQGGQLSIQEAVYHGVPVLGVPIVGEQETTLSNIVQKGFAEVIYTDNLPSVQKLTETLKNFMTSDKYRVSIEHFSRLMRDRPIEPVDHAVFWIEYVIRHNGSQHLRFQAVKNLNFFQYFMIDVIAFIVLLLCAAFFCTYKLLKFLWRAISPRRKVQADKNKKTQ